MASTYTSNSGVEKPGIGDQSGEWGTTVNTNMDILDRAINGVGVITLSGTTHTLTTTDGALSDGQYKVLVLSGSPSGTNTITISPNDQDKLYFVVNSSGQTATFSQGSGANVSVVNGDTKIIYADGAGSGAAVTEFASEADALEGITAGTVSASKAVIVDANKDITGFRNVTLTGELDAGSLDISGDADIDGTLEADAMTLDGTAITTTATLSTGISNGNLPVFTTGVSDDDFLRVAGTSIEGRSAAEVLSDIGGQASLTFGISNTNAVKVDSASVADNEYARFTANGLESRSNSEVFSDIGASPAEGSSSIVTTGALDAGSITSGFGAIDNGSSAITTTGVITGGTVEVTTDTAAGDNAAIGYTAAEGLILTGQGSTSDVTIKNDADATVLSIPTGTTNVGIGTTSASKELELGALDVFRMQTGSVTMDCTPTAGATDSFVWNTSVNAIYRWDMNGTERMRIDSSGNVGIGTTSPANRLHVVDSTSAGTIKMGNDYHGFIRQDANDLDIISNGDQAYRAGLGTNNGTGNIVFQTANLTQGNTERMRISANGYLMVATTNTSVGIGNTNTGFLVENNGTFLASRADQIAGSLNRNNDGTILTLRRGGNEVGTIGVTSSSTSYNTTSDYRLKENVNYTFDATTRLKQLKPARFNFISDDTNTLVDGFIAHEVSSVVPEAITGEKDGEEMQGIDQSKLVPLLVKTIQELEARITALEAG